MAAAKVQQLSRRERQIMDTVYRRGRASAAEVLEGLPDPPSYSAVRRPPGSSRRKATSGTPRTARDTSTSPSRRDDAARTALKGVLKTFFDGSPEKAVAALLDAADAELTPEALKNLNRLIEQARKEGR